MIQFLLNQQQVVLQEHAADCTVLDYLRNQKNLTGTKEGCASGDCGACTVVLAEAADNGLTYRSINSCITFIGALHGKQLLTVEHLASQQTLHPVQQSMVDLHGSQCGFCTPGFVMSLFALYKSVEQQQEDSCKHRIEDAIEDYLGGNLCRCTGYRSIRDAALASLEKLTGDQFTQEKKPVIKKLSALSVNDQISDTGNSLLPDSINSLISCIKDNPHARLVAGGTDMALEVTQQLQTISKMIHLEQVAELCVITQNDEEIEIGAAVSLSQCQEALIEHCPQCAELFARFGSRQIRNSGTIGGNIANASPIGDLPPMLIAMNAKLRLQAAETIRELPIDSFFLDYKKTALQPAEFIRSIVIPKPCDKRHFRIYKISKRIDDDISAVCMAISIELSESNGGKISNVRIALGGMAAIPKRAALCESALEGQEFNPQTIESATIAIASEFAPVSDARASARYRLQVTQNLLSRFYLELSQPDLQVRISHGE